MIQNNEDTIKVYLKGDEYGSWYETLDVYSKVREMDVPENNPTITMNLEGLNSGVYVLRLIIDNQTLEASQLIII